MNEIRYKIVLDGVPLPNVAPQTLQANLAQLFKISQERAATLMGRAGMVVKRNLPHTEAERYVQALHKAGAVSRKEVDVVPTVDALMKEPSTQATPLPGHAQHGAQVESQELVLLNPYSVNGRIGRLRYFAWMTVILVSLVAAFTPVVAAIYWIAGASAISTTAYTIVGTLAFLLLSFFSICSTAQRLHDIGYSAAYALIGFIPLVNWIFSFTLCFIPGNAQENDYGLPPPPNGTAVHILTAVGLVFPVVVVAGAFVALMLD